MGISQEKEDSLVEQFNRRDIAAFGQVYTSLYDQLYYFTASVCRSSDLVPDDVIHDIFVKIWSAYVEFSTLEGIKAYILTSIRNQFHNHVIRKKREERYRQMALMDDDWFVVQIAESGVKSYVNQAIDALPEECAEILKYHLEGWYTKEIADKMGVSERTVYNRKNEALDLLKSHLDEKTLAAILLICSQL